MTSTEAEPLREFVPGAIWLRDYPIRYAGTAFNATMSVVRLEGDRLLLHSPCAIDERLAGELGQLGRVAYIAAPGTYHYFHVASAQQAFPEAETYICPGIEKKRPELEFDALLGDAAPPAWADELEQVLVQGSRFIWEVAFLHVASKTLILVDLVENIGDGTPGTNWVLRMWWKGVFRMWNHPKPAPEYQLGWKDKAAAARSLGRILDWDFERVIVSHGDPIVRDAKATVREAWRVPLGGRADG